MGDVDSGNRPKPPRIPKPLPQPASAGWWVSPGLDPRVLRYHDGQDWTSSVCRLGLRGPGPVELSPLVEEVTAEPEDGEIAALPRPPRVPLGLDRDRPRPGWYMDPDEGSLNLKHLRYHDGKHWTEFVCELSLGGPGATTRKTRTTDNP